MTDKARRQGAILRLVRERQISTQEELVNALSAAGHAVVQTTVSRDIHELKLTKVRGPSGSLVYAPADTPDSDRLRGLVPALQRWALTVEASGSIVVVNFWASWCIPCRAEAPALQAIWERYRERGVIVLGVNWTETSDQTAQAFMQEFGMTYPNGLDRGTRIADLYHITGVPETFVIDQEGNVAQFFYAEINEGDLSALLETLLEPTS